MEVTQIISFFLSVLFPGMVVWVMRLQGQIAELKTSVAVNTSKDVQLSEHVLKMETKLDEISKSVAYIREEIAKRK